MDDRTVYVLVQRGDEEAVQLYVSEDAGASFRMVDRFPVQKLEQINLVRLFHADRALVILKNEENQLERYWIKPNAHILENIPTETPLDAGVIPANVTGWQTDTLSRWYTYVEQDMELRLYKTEDEGRNWEFQGILPAVPWEVGISGSPSDPDLLFLGEVECFRSRNSGKNWEKINPWYAYYRDIQNNLHADMMHFGEYQTADSVKFMLISHHGGLSYSEDFFITMRNYAMENLNITQYYDTKTSPLDPNLVFAGSQDQGLQFNLGFSEGGPSPLQQLLPGDYDHLTFSSNGQSLWAVSPGGWVIWLKEAAQAEPTASWTLPNYQHSIWFPPLTPLRDTTQIAVLIGGGSASEEEGSFLIKLQIQDEKVLATQLPFNFQVNSGGGLIAALATSPTWPNHWFAATTNGQFFLSLDQGQNWTSAASIGTQADLFYSQVILPSQQDSMLLYWGGAGYDQPPLLRSLDGGRTFSDFSQGLPPTIVFDVAANEDESLLFAATQAGAYVYNQEAGKWFDLSAPCTPVQHYMSVEFLSSTQTVRFSTFGRGIWDFQLDGSVPVNHPVVQHSTPEWKVFPNPTNGAFYLELASDPSNQNPATIRMFNNQGQLLLQKTINPGVDDWFFEVNEKSDLPPGIYWLSIQQGSQLSTQKVIITY